MATEISISFSTFEIIVTPDLDEAAIRAIVGGADAFDAIDEIAIADRAVEMARWGGMITSEGTVTDADEIETILVGNAREEIQEGIDTDVEALMARLEEARAVIAMQARCENALNKGQNWALSEEEMRSAYEFGEREFQCVDLRGASLWRACLRESDLSGADLSGADLSDADLSGANLSGANLSGANLSGANLEGTNLEGSNLEGATTVLAPSDDLGESPFTGAAEQSTTKLVGPPILRFSTNGSTNPAADTVITVSRRDNEREIGNLSIRCQVSGNDIYVYGWIGDNEHVDFEVGVATVEVPGLEDTDEDEEFSFILTAQQIERALRTYRETYL